MLTLAFDRTSCGPPSRTGRQVNEWHDDLGQPFARAFGDQDGYWVEWPGVGCFALDAATATVTAWPAPQGDERRAADVFARVLQPLLLQAMGHQALHASAAETPTGALVFCGPSGAGKSTLAYAVAREAGCTQMADDAVVLDLGDTQPRVRPLPFEPQLRRSAAVYFSAGAPRPSPPAVHDNSCSVLLRAIVLLEQHSVSGEGTRLIRVEPRTAFRGLLTHAHAFDASNRAANAAMVNVYLTVAGNTPVYSLRYRASFAHLPDVIGAVLRIEPGGVP